MELIWLVLTLIAVDLGALLFAADTRPGLQHSSRPGFHRSPSAGQAHVSRWPRRHASGG
ncbi:MAG TPA: hypothetical protein VHS79_11175 [Actinomycetes bacterium]|jgi:hypothetical protein|nr:hypothetical protein [Actinomycetes bacterium]